MDDRKCAKAVAHQIGIEFELSARNSDRPSASEFVIRFSAHQFGTLNRYTIPYIILSKLVVIELIAPVKPNAAVQ